VSPDENDEKISSIRERVAVLESKQLRDQTSETLGQVEAVQDMHNNHIVTLIERTDNIEEKVVLLAQELGKQTQRADTLEREAAENRRMAAEAVEILEVSLDLITGLKDVAPTVHELLERVRSVASTSSRYAKFVEVQEALQKISISLNRLTSVGGELTPEVRRDFEADFARFQRARLGIEFLVPAETYSILTEMATLATKAHRLRMSGDDHTDNWAHADELCDQFLGLRPSAVERLRVVNTAASN